MALSQSVSSELLEAFRAGEGVDLIRESVRLVMQDLIEVDVAEHIGAGRYERSETRTTQRNGSRPKLISKGGGVHARTAKSIPITPEVREVLGLDDDVTKLSPPELLHAILAAPVDLLWNGGIGTYVKASTEP